MYEWGGEIDGCCRPISMHEVCCYLGTSQHILEQFSSLQHDVSVRWTILVPVKYGIVSLMLALVGTLKKPILNTKILE